jgi:DNA topoisomerase-1
MPNSLVIVESPAKCKKIESYLGPGYKVIASFGHLRTISGLESIDIKNNFNTTYSVIHEDIKLKQIEKIRSEITNSCEVIIATDDDREGEAIGWHICELFGLNITNTKRIIFHEITESAIKSAISHPKRINMKLVEAQQSRQILDLLVGYTISPILWNNISKTYKASLSAGRCQTPALRLIYDNYLDIKSSPGRTVFDTTGYFTNLTLPFELNKQFTTDNEVTEFLELCKEWEFMFTSTLPKKVIKKAPEPLTTSNLQQLASNELHMSPKDTMKYAQQLYEGGYITYMRTDSKKYSQEFVNSVAKYIINLHGEQYVSSTIGHLSVENKIEETSIISDKKETKKKKTLAEQRGIPTPQEAHEAIRPVNINITSLTLSEDPTVELQAKAIKLYELIWQRSCESCMSSAQYNSVTAKIIAPINTEFNYKVEQPIFLGWQIIEKAKDKNKDKNTQYQYITTLKQNVIINFKTIEIKFNMNGLKTHYTEARLIQLLEEKGIGRPSTFASLVDKIQERKYVEKQNIIGKELEGNDYSLNNNNISKTIVKKQFGNENNKLVIQPIGIIVIEFLLAHFESIFNYNYTKEMEDDLDLIANGSKKLNELCDTCYKELTTITNSLKELKKFSLRIDDEHTLIIGKHGPVVKYVSSKNNKTVSFLPVKKDLDIDAISRIQNVSLEDILDQNIVHSEAIGKYKGQDLFIKKGKYGVYAQWGKETKALKDEFGSIPLENIEYIEVIRYLDRDNVLDPTKPIGLIRELNNHISIRTGKFGDYIFYKKPRMKKPEFLKINGFNSDYKKCDKVLILNWIKQTYNIE